MKSFGFLSPAVRGLEEKWRAWMGLGKGLERSSKKIFGHSKRICGESFHHFLAWFIDSFSDKRWMFHYMCDVIATCWKCSCCATQFVRLISQSNNFVNKTAFGEKHKLLLVSQTCFTTTSQLTSATRWCSVRNMKSYWFRMHVALCYNWKTHTNYCLRGTHTKSYVSHTCFTMLALEDAYQVLPWRRHHDMP